MSKTEPKQRLTFRSSNSIFCVANDQQLSLWTLDGFSLSQVTTTPARHRSDHPRRKRKTGLVFHVMIYLNLRHCKLCKHENLRCWPSGFVHGSNQSSCSFYVENQPINRSSIKIWEDFTTFSDPHPHPSR